jgi:hypothetical protein
MRRGDMLCLEDQFIRLNQVGTLGSRAASRNHLAHVIVQFKD